MKDTENENQAGAESYPPMPRATAEIAQMHYGLAVRWKDHPTKRMNVPDESIAVEGDLLTIPQAKAFADATAALRARGAVPSVKYVPVAAGLRDENWQHPNDDEPRTDACDAALDERGDNSGQGLDGFWKWGFRAGFNAALAAPAAPMSAQPSDAEIEALAVQHEAFGFGKVDAKGFTSHGFDPDGMAAFIRAVLERWGAAPQPPAALPGEQDAARSIELTEDVRFILGFICFQCIHIVQALRLGGREINTKAEDEQAAAIHFMLNHYLADRENWRENVNAELRTMVAKGRAGGAA